MLRKVRLALSNNQEDGEPPQILTGIPHTVYRSTLRTIVDGGHWPSLYQDNLLTLKLGQLVSILSVLSVK